MIDVEDEGSGLTSDQMKRLFQPFDRLGQGAQIQGTGIGLVLTRLLMAAMDGTIAVRSEPGRGSCFTLNLPRRPAPNP
jgi:signal transduction histidine kinase